MKVKEKDNIKPSEDFLTYAAKIGEYERLKKELESQIEAIQNKCPDKPNGPKFLITTPDNKYRFHIDYDTHEENVVTLKIEANYSDNLLKYPDWYSKGSIDIPLKHVNIVVDSLKYFIS
jgi:hypothetical protein